LLAVVPVARPKGLACGWPELVVCISWSAASAWLLEKRMGQIAPQGWEFYAVTGALFLTLAFPGLRLALPGQAPR
jgi:hypothetical protein